MAQPDIPQPTTALKRFCVYGIELALDWQPRAPLVPGGEGAAAVELTVQRVPSVPVPPEAEEPIAKGGELDGLYRMPDGFVFSFGSIARFHVTRERIAYELSDEHYAYGIELWLLGTVLSFWLEWQQRPALHASAAVINGQAVGFMATNKGGKSSLAATLMQQGHPLLTDDILALTPGAPTFAHPGFPQMRMWPEQAAHFVPDKDALATVHPYIEKKRVPVDQQGIGGSFCDEARPLAALYLPERGDDVEAIRIEPMPQAEALLMLVRESFVAKLIEAAGWQGQRLGVLSKVVKAVPVRRLIYPNGIEKLPAVADTLQRDVKALSQQ